MNDLRRLSSVLLFLIVFSSLSFSSVIWSLSLGSSTQKANPVTTKPVLFGNALIVTAQDGSVYAVSPTSGNSLWTRNIGGYPRQPVLLENLVVVGSSNGNITAFRSDGSIRWSVNAGSYVYGLGAGTNKVYATTRKGVISIDKNGNAQLIYNESNGTYTAPATNDEYIVFGVDDQLVALRAANNKVVWAKEVANFWKSDPVIDGSRVFIGALDNNFYAFDVSDGFYRWKTETKGWVLSTPYVYNSKVYFGSNDGYVYSVNWEDGKVRWKVETGEAVQSTPVAGLLGTADAIFIGSNDNNLYAIDDKTGTELWKQPAKDWVHSPIVMGKSIIFGSHDGKLYSVSTERACTIDSPQPGTLVGYREAVVRGKAFSEYGDSKVFVRVNEGNWAEIQNMNGSWIYVLDPNLYQFGIMQFECKIKDSYAEETSPYTSLSLQRSENVPKEKMTVIFPSTVEEGKDFEVLVIDGKKEPVLNFDVTFQGKAYKGSGKVAIPAGASGEAQKLVVSKPGFDNAVVGINVTASANPFFIIVGIVVVLAIIAFVYYTRIMKK